MPATASGRIIKTRKGKKGTQHQKNHRWESFTSKISKLSSLDPIRRVRRHDIDAEDLSTTTSYFKAGLEKWQELNMSEGFISFAHEVNPLCDSLPQILHFEDKIMDLLITYIEKKERESVEPLLELLTDFAHDLGARFERHYAKALEMVTTIAGIPQDVEVIEWSFTCLAFLFKYLSKLLVSDLRPTYNLMAPLMGKHRQQPHIARFAAEAMSFLVKKAGVPANREKALPLIVQHAKSDLLSLVGAREFGLYYHGIMTLFAEAMKGNGLSIHTTGPTVFQSLFEALEEKDLAKESPWMDVICGVLTSMVHHTSPETFKDVLEVILSQASTSVEKFAQSRKVVDLHRILLSTRTIGIAAGVRKGARIADWPALLQAMSKILLGLSKDADLLSRHDDELDLWKSVVFGAAITLQYAPMDAIIPVISPYMDSLTKDPFATWFLTFCSYLSEADSERFRSIALPYFRRFIVAHWSDADNGDTLCVLLPKMVGSGILPNRYGKDGFPLPQSWQDQIVSKFERLEVSPFPEQASPALVDRSPKTWHDRCLPKYNALLEVLECTIVHPSTNARIAEILLRKLKLALRPSSSLAPEEAHFIVGRGFSSFSRMSRGAGEMDRALEPLLLAAAPRYSRLPNFLEALLTYQKSLSSASNTNLTESISVPSPNKDDINSEADLLVSSLIMNLSSGSHDLRLLSLRLLEHISSLNNGSNAEALSLMIMIEQTPLDMHSARGISMHIRKLAALYPNQSEVSWLKQAIPSFCFGMLTIRLSSIWDDATAALKQISESKAGEEAVAKIAFNWLETPSAVRNEAGGAVEQSRNNGLTDFECSNMMTLAERGNAAEHEVKKARDTMLDKFEVAQQLVDSQPSSARTQALRVLATTPQIAERRSRQLVPMFLSWSSKPGDDVEEESRLSDWTRKDQKSQLDLFGLFVNPKSLFKSEEIHAALLRLVANGDIDLQRSALKAIFTWKNSSIKPYEENLLNLLDEARFKDEITILLQGQTLVQPEHRPDLMPVLLGLLYGRSISRKGAASGRQGMEARRLTILRNLDIEDIGGFLDIALGDLSTITLIKGDLLQESVFHEEVLSVRKQVGFMNMMEGILKELGTKVVPLTKKLLEAVLYCLISASRQLGGEPNDSDDEEIQTSQTSLLKVIRQTGLKCLILLYTNSTDFDWSLYTSIVVSEIILPRLENLPIETAQGVSGILRLFSTWSASSKTVFLLGSHNQILSTVADCLAPQKSKDEVKLFALNVIRNVVRHAREGADTDEAAVIKTELLTPNMDSFLTQIGSLLRNHHDLSKDLLEGCVETVSELASFVSNSTQAHHLVDVSVFLLDQPSRRVSPKTKSGLLLVLEHFVPLYDLQNDIKLKDRVYNTITSLFGYFKDKSSREVLSRVLLVYSNKDPVIASVAELCLDLNSFMDGRLDEPDYDKRIQAFSSLSKGSVPFTARQWRPLLFNMLYYIKHEEDFAILSSNSSDGICHFIDTANKAECDSEKAEFKSMLACIVLPAIFSGAREQSEVIRREYVKVMAHLTRTFSEWSEVSDMHGLLAGDDELESSFFNNILAAGKGRQSSALGQLSSASEKGELSSKNVSQFFIPLVEHFVFDRAEGNDAHNLAAEATTAVGILASSLEWPQYRAMLRRFIGYVAAKPNLAKQIIRLLGRVIDALALAASDPEDSDVDIETPKKQSILALTMPKQFKLADDLTSNIIPPLTEYLHDKDESTVSLRVPVAIIIVRLLKLLPEEQLNERLPAVLTDICHILRSKAQESRDMTRDTLTKICVLLGPSCFGFVLKELRGALARGYQLHVLSYTMHSILVATTPEYSPGDLDYCLPSIVAIIMDDIFGATGQEKDAEEYVSKMKEVKSSKSHDSMELIAKTATLSRLTDLVRPIQALLKERLNLRMIRKIDELLNRISTGLLRNSAAQSRDSLIFCYEVIQEVYNSGKPQAKLKEDYRLKKYLIQKGAKKSGDRGSTTIYTYKLIRFALDVMRAVLKKYDDLRTVKNLAGFLPILGDAIAEGEEEVKVAAFKMLVTIVRVPWNSTNKEGTDIYRIAVDEAIRSITASSDTTSDIAQASLKLISVVLRDRRDIPVKDTAIDRLLSRLKDDITQPERRHTTFNFLRSVLDSKVETAVVYDTLDYVGTIMVTNQDSGTRDLARGAYFQFLREYPQTTKRWKKQLKFIVDNLLYTRPGGRLSILEVISLLLQKSSNVVQEVCESCFGHLIMVLGNDDHEDCRKAAGAVLKEIFRKADTERTKSFLDKLRVLIKHEKPAVVRVAYQIFGFYYETLSDPQNPTDAPPSDVLLLQQSLLASIQTQDGSDSEWELIYASLQLISILTLKYPSSLLSLKSTPLWTSIRRCLSYPHAWVKFSSSKLINIYFADFASNNMKENGLRGFPMKGSFGMNLNACEVMELIGRVVNMLKTPSLNEELAEEIVKNLGFLGRISAANGLKWRGAQSADPSSSDNEEEEEDEREDGEGEGKSALDFLFGRLSFVLRREISPPRAVALIPKTASLKILALLSSTLPVPSLLPSLPTILLPLHHLTDKDIPTPYSTDGEFKKIFAQMREDALEIMEGLKRRVGTEVFSGRMVEVVRGVKERRGERRGKRVRERVVEPEKWGEGKRRKVVRKKERRKERGAEHGRRRNEF